MNLARVLTLIASYIAPADAREWTEALQAEIAYVPSGEALFFAAGGVVMALRLRLGHPSFISAAARYGLAGAAVIWAWLHLRVSADLQRTDASLPHLLTFAPAAMFALGGAVTAATGLRFTVLLAFLTLGVVLVCATAAGLLAPESPHSALRQAVAFEDVVVLCGAMLLVAAARRYNGHSVKS